MVSRDGVATRITTRWVEGEAQGDEDALKKLLKDIDEGPRSAKVVKLDQEERDLIEDEKDFLVRR
ncbi:uncharacterized protein ColSpa_00283 [Colletotrichum spaethianum]|uniref:Acylphosphatase-like domain-containing protein n=1 Tax=Colletotrichum spaethianum TaxID=700344 RepID=A0AA37NSU0_9PEZI|nr:uncharacterized protein ColSpa_00283 [Colletotrichum spaethianum]GKT40102.1 hypothetical protein ColSpa_00283 [Colletotrichum spaethianum]